MCHGGIGGAHVREMLARARGAVTRPMRQLVHRPGILQPSSHALRVVMVSQLSPPRCMATESTPTSFLERTAARLNASIADAPVITGACMVAMDMATIGSVYGMFWIGDVSASAELALAFVASRPLRRLRLPLEVVTAEALGRLVPALTHVKLSNALRALSGQPPAPVTETLSTSNALHEFWGVLREVRTLFRTPMRALQALNDAAMFVLDRLGVAYTLASRLVGLGIVGLLYAAISSGLDVQGWLEARGWAAAGSIAGTWAAAVLCSSVLYPATLVGTSYLAPVVARAVRAASK